MDELIVTQKINEANRARSELESKRETIRVKRRRLDQDEKSVDLEDQKLLTKIEAWKELLPHYSLSDHDAVTERDTSPANATSATTVQKRDRRPAPRWLKVLRLIDNTSFEHLFELVKKDVPEVEEKALKDQIRRYTTNDSPLLMESNGKLILTDKAKDYVKDYVNTLQKEEEEELMELIGSSS